MAKDETKRQTPKQLQEDKDTFTAAGKLTGYSPANKDFTLDIGTAKQKTREDKQAEEVVAERALKTARDVATAAEWDFHNYILGVKKQVAAQYGDDSNEIQSLGLKKKSEYKKPKKKADKK